MLYWRADGWVGITRWSATRAWKCRFWRCVHLTLNDHNISVVSAYDYDISISVSVRPQRQCHVSVMSAYDHNVSVMSASCQCTTTTSVSCQHHASVRPQHAVVINDAVFVGCMYGGFLITILLNIKMLRCCRIFGPHFGLPAILVFCLTLLLLWVSVRLVRPQVKGGGFLRRGTAVGNFK